MPADIVNLNRFRKARAKDAARETAEKNRLKHGESRAARQKREALRAQSENKLDQATLDKAARDQAGTVKTDSKTQGATSEAPTAFNPKDTSKKSTGKDLDPGSQT